MPAFPQSSYQDMLCHRQEVFFMICLQNDGKTSVSLGSEIPRNERKGEFRCATWGLFSVRREENKGAGQPMSLYSS